MYVVNCTTMNHQRRERWILRTYHLGLVPPLLISVLLQLLCEREIVLLYLCIRVLGGLDDALQHLRHRSSWAQEVNQSISERKRGRGETKLGRMVHEPTHLLLLQVVLFLPLEQRVHFVLSRELLGFELVRRETQRSCVLVALHFELRTGGSGGGMEMGAG